MNNEGSFFLWTPKMDPMNHMFIIQRLNHEIHPFTMGRIHDQKWAYGIDNFEMIDVCEAFFWHS